MTIERPMGLHRVRWTITARLIAIVLTLAVPLNLGTGAAVWSLAKAANEAERASLAYSASSVAAAVDAELSKYIALAEALSRSPALLEDKLDTFESEARRTFRSVLDAWVVVTDLDGLRLVNTSARSGQPLDRRAPIAFAAQKQALATGMPVVSDVFVGPIVANWIGTVEVPVFKNGRAFRGLAVIMSAHVFADLLNAREMPSNWLAGIIDSQGRFIARVPDNDANVGQLSSEGFRSSKDRSISEFNSLEGDPVVNASAHSILSGWTVSIAVKKAELQGAAVNIVFWATIFGGSISLLSLLLAIIIARRITRPITDLRQKTAAVLADPSVSFETSLPEIGEVWTALKFAAAERKRAEAHVLLLMREVNHRCKNMLSIVYSIALHTGASDYKEFLEQFSQRIKALSANQDLLVENDWRGVGLSDLVHQQLAHFSDVIGTRILVRGPQLQLTPAAAQAIGMALHELATNAVKYGALSNQTGCVEITWGSEGEEFSIQWLERDGPCVEKPTRRGFGSSVLSAVVNMTVGGAAELKYAATGVIWRLTCPATEAVGHGEPAKPPAIAANVPTGGLTDAAEQPIPTHMENAAKVIPIDESSLSVVNSVSPRRGS